MNLQQLEYIVAVAELKSFTKAADYCCVTQATLSAMVKKLESELEVVLFDRKANPIVCTDIGKELVQKAKVILKELEGLKNLVKDAQASVEGKVRLGIIPTVANALLPLILKPLLQSFPLLELEITELTTRNIISQLRSGSLDLGILATPLHEENIQVSPLYYEPLLVYGREGKTYYLPEEIQQEQIWLMEEGHCLREQTLELCSLKRNDSVAAQLKFEANSFGTLLNLVDDFGGMTIIPELYAKRLSPERKQKIGHFLAPTPVREISLVAYRPFAKNRIIKALTPSIKALVKPHLSLDHQNKDLLRITKL